MAEAVSEVLEVDLFQLRSEYEKKVLRKRKAMFSESAKVSVYRDSEGYVWVANPACREVVNPFPHERNALAEVERHVVGKVFYDVGAFQGLYAIRLGKKAEKVYAFEPSPISHSILKLNAFLNKVPIEAHQLCISAIDGVTWFPVRSQPFSGNFAYFSDNKIGIETYTIDTLVFTKGFKPPQVMKIDVEGHELEVLDGAVLTLQEHKPTLLIEYHPRIEPAPGYTQELIIETILKTLNYTIKEMDGSKLLATPKEDTS